MQLMVNGKPHEVKAEATAADLLAELGLPHERVAVVVNENVVRRADLPNAKLSNGDVVEVITMVGGG